MRTFISIDLDQEIKKAIFGFIKQLDKGVTNIRWTKPQGMHLTLKFLGEISQEKGSQVEAALKRISEQYQPFTFKVKGTGTFPPGFRNPRVLWIGIEEKHILSVLQNQLENDLNNLGFPKENRKFHPHITLGRVKYPRNIEPTLSLLKDKQEHVFGEMKVEKITFFKSILKSSGAEYSIISEHILQ